MERVLMLTVMCHMFSQEFTFSDAIIRSMFKNVLCSVNMQCVYVLCERGYGLKTNKMSCSNNLELLSPVVVFKVGFSFLLCFV